MLQRGEAMEATLHTIVSPFWQEGREAALDVIADSYVADRPRYHHALDEAHYAAIRDSFLPIDTLPYKLAISPLFSPYDQSIIVQGKDSQQIYYLHRTDYLSRIIIDLQPHGLAARNCWVAYFTELYRDNPATFESIMRGINYYLAQDYFASTYTLTFQVEEYLRLFAQRYQLPVTERTRHGLEKQPVGRILPRLAVHLPPNLLNYAIWILIDREGLNLRNRAAHGLLKHQDTTAIPSTALLHLLTILHRLYQLSE